MARIGVGRGRVKFGDAFFKWLWDQMLMVEDYAYVGTYFTNDPNLPLPPRGKWGDIGKKQETLKMENVFLFFMFYIFYDK